MKHRSQHQSMNTFRRHLGIKPLVPTNIQGVRRYEASSKYEFKSRKNKFYKIRVVKFISKWFDYKQLFIKLPYTGVVPIAKANDERYFANM